MARLMKKMAKTMKAEHGGAIRAELLFCGPASRAQRGTTRLHQHPHWQAEIAVKGPIGFITGDTGHELLAGDTVLLSPGALHGFTYPDEPVHWVTLRFVIHGLAAVPAEHLILPAGSEAAGFSGLLAALLDNRAWPASAARTAAAEHALAGLAAFVYTPRNSTARAAGYGENAAGQADEYIQAHLQRNITVREIAEAMGYSESHAAALYRKTTGRSIKDAVDHARAEYAQRLLAYSDQRISEVAYAMDFKDVYAFSRFFKRLTGKSPREFRNTYFRQAETF